MHKFLKLNIKQIMSDPVLWDVLFFDCCLSAPVCCLACICPGVVQSMSFHKLKQSSCLRCLFAQYCCCIGLSVNRSKIREICKIDGNCRNECLLYCCFACCCHAFLSTQEYRQVSLLNSGNPKS